MGTRHFSIVLPLAILAACRGTTPEQPVDPVGAELDRYLSARTEMGQWSGAVLVAKGDQVLLRKGYGFSDVERKAPYTAETRQPVASISKMFTALAALKLRDRGKLALQDSVCDHLDDCPEAWRPVTIDHLIHHESGIPDYEERLELGSEAYFDLMTHPGASAKILADAKTRPLEFAPGEKFHYSNSGYVVLGFALERASGMRFTDLLQETVLGPVGMSESGALAVGYTYGDLGWPAMLRGLPLDDGHLKPVRSLTMTPPQGDAWLESTVDDLLRFSRAIAANAEVAQAGKWKYGAGWIVDEAFGRRRMHHNGIVPGYVSELIRFPDDGVTIVLLSNLDRVRLSRIARDVSAIALGQPYDMPVRGTVITLTPEQVGRLTGDYTLADGRVINVRQEPDYLIAELKGQYTAGLIPLSPTEMYFPLGDGRAIFEPGADGRAVRLNMRHSGEDHVAERR